MIDGGLSKRTGFSARGMVRAAILVAGLLTVVAPRLAAQNAPVLPPAVELPAPDTPLVTPPLAENPGLINEIGKLFQPPSWMPALPKMKTPSEAMNDWNAQAKSMSDSLQGMGSSTVAKGRVACPMTAHGAPDCKAASDILCKSKGYKEGKSLDTDSARTCSAQALLTGRKLEERDCKTEHYVTQAVCQQ